MLTCLWCGAPVPPARGRRATRKFCAESHRLAFHTAARQWAIAMVDAGLVPPQAIAAFGNKQRREPNTDVSDAIFTIPGT